MNKNREKFTLNNMKEYLLMNKYPFVYFLRDNNFSEIDSFFEENKEKLQCTVEIISPNEIYKLNNMFNPNYHILITYGPEEEPYIIPVCSIIVDRMRERWIHKKTITDINEFNINVNFSITHAVYNSVVLVVQNFLVLARNY